MKKQVLGAVLVALLGVAGPAMSVGAAPVGSQSAQPGTLHIILVNGGANSFDFYDSQDSGVTFGATPIATLAGAVPANSVDVQVPAGNSHKLKACVVPSGSNACVPPANGNSNVFSVAGGGNVTVIGLGGLPGIFTSANDVSPTSLGNARFTVNNLAGASVPVCVNNAQFGPVAGIPSPTQQAQEFTAQQNVPIKVGAAAVGCPNGNAATFSLNFAAGTNSVFTIAPAAPGACTTACVQVLIVDQGRPTNSAATAAFCATLNPGLTGIQAEVKSTFGGVTVGNSATFPSIAAVQTLVNDINAQVAAGDASVSATVKPQWEIATSGLRTLASGLTAAGFDVSKLSNAALQKIVDGANGVNQAADPAGDAAKAVLTNFFLANCIAAAAPKFTG